MNTEIEGTAAIGFSAPVETKSKKEAAQESAVEVSNENPNNTEAEADSKEAVQKAPKEFFVTEMIDKEAYISGRRGYHFVKRVQDIFFSALALVVLSPLMLITAICIVIDDPKGGPFFSQIRFSKDGKPFRLYKFRSMCVDAEEKLAGMSKKNEADGPAFKVKKDERVTRFGHFIRKTIIDELPQLVNILKGDMSIVGPRPPLPNEVEEYRDYDLQRLYVKPGLTCIWQIQPNRNDICFDRWVAYDVKYIKNRSFLLDWKLIFMTVKAVIFGYGN